MYIKFFSGIGTILSLGCVGGTWIYLGYGFSSSIYKYTLKNISKK